MAEKAKVDDRHTYMELWNVTAEVGELTMLEARWAGEDKRNRYLYKHLWHNAMGGIENLEEKYREGKMTAGQENGYRELKGLLVEVAPIIERLGFSPPSVPLDDAEKVEVGNWRIYKDLWNVAAEAGYLPKREARWAKENARDRFDHERTWHTLMGKLESLDETCRTGRMTPGQETGYRELKGLLKEVVPVIKQLGFTLPPVPLHNA